MSFADELSEAFYQWESRLRGWDVYPYTVKLEPPLVPLQAYLEPELSASDDGRQHTFLSTISKNVAEFLSPKSSTSPINKSSSDPLYDEDGCNDVPEHYLSPDEEYYVFRIALPQDYSGSLRIYKNLLQSLRYAHSHLSFEIIGNTNEICVQLGAWKTDSETLLKQLRSHFPEATVVEAQDSINDHARTEEVLCVDFGLEHEVMNALGSITDLKNDPLTALIGSMEELGDDEHCIFQLLFTHVDDPWAQTLRNGVIYPDGSPLFSDSTDLVQNVKIKTSAPLYACVIRVCVIASNEHRRWELAKAIGGAIAQYDAPSLNNLMPLDNEEYDDIEHYRDIVARTTHRSGMIVSLNELVSFLHFPDAIVRSDKLARQRLKTKAAPGLASGHTLVLGRNEHRGQTTEVSLSTQQRTRHMYVVGASGTGKSTLLLNCIRQDIENDQGICVLDPHGDLIDQALAYIPERRIKDVILLDPSDEKFPIGLNIFDAHSNLEKTLIASDLTAVFERLSTTWGDQMTTVLSQGVLAMLESPRDATLHDLRRFLIERDFREEFLTSVQDQEVVYYWQKQFPLLSGRPQASVLTRLDTFLRPKPIRHMVAQRKSSIDFAKVMDEGKILLAKLSHGGIGEENAYLLGALLASKIHQSALARQAVTQDKRRPFWLYIDEFQNFLTPSIAQTLSGARKYSLGMVLAHQELTQLSLANKAVAASVIANPYTRICFRMGDRDARTLSEGFSTFDSKDLQSLGIGEAIGRIEQAKYDFSLSTYPLPDVIDPDINYKINAIRAASRAKYATPREEVEKLLRIDISQNTVSDKNRTKPIIDNSKKSIHNAPIKTKLQKGKGGKHHKEIQLQLQKVAHAKGLGATIEHHIGDGQHIDLLINAGNKKIACEISVSTGVEHEISNISKCLHAGFGYIYVISDSKDHSKNIQTVANSTFSKKTRKHIRFYEIDEALETISSMNARSTIQLTRGYETNIAWKDISSEEKKRREMVFAKITKS